MAKPHASLLAAGALLLGSGSLLMVAAGSHNARIESATAAAQTKANAQLLTALSTQAVEREARSAEIAASQAAAAQEAQKAAEARATQARQAQAATAAAAAQQEARAKAAAREAAAQAAAAQRQAQAQVRAATARAAASQRNSPAAVARSAPSSGAPPNGGSAPSADEIASAKQTNSIVGASASEARTKLGIHSTSADSIVIGGAKKAYRPGSTLPSGERLLQVQKKGSGSVIVTDKRTIILN